MSGREPVGVARLAAILVVGVAVLSSCGIGNGTNTSSSGQTGVAVALEPATTRLAEAIDLITQVAGSVSPGATMTALLPDGQPQDCSAPLTGQVYYTITRSFQAPTGKTGASLVDAIVAVFHDRGYTTQNLSDFGDHLGFQGEDTHIGFSVLAYKNSGYVQINMDTQCGSPAATSAS